MPSKKKNIIRSKALATAYGGRFYPNPTEKRLFKAILMAFEHYNNNSLTQTEIVDYVRQQKIVKTRSTMELGIYKLALAGYFKLLHKNRAKIWYLMKKAKDHLEYIKKQ